LETLPEFSLYTPKFFNHKNIEHIKKSYGVSYDNEELLQIFQSPENTTFKLTQVFLN